MSDRVYGVKSGFKNLLLRSLGKKRILFASHEVTSKCMCRCKTCPIWRMKETHEPDLKTEKMIIDRFKEAGVVVAVFTGGEPLLRKDIPEILKYSYDSGFVTSVVTNGYLLKNRAKEFYKFVDRICVSLDSANPQVHNKIRGIKIFDRAVEGIKSAVDLGAYVIINCVISKYNIDHVEDVLYLGEKLGVSGVLFDPVQASFFGGDFSHIAFNEKEYKALKEKIQLLSDLKKQGHKVMNTTRYLNFLLEPEKFENVKCDTFGIKVKWDGKAYPAVCNYGFEQPGFLKNGISLENHSINEIIEREDVKKAIEMMGNCRRCNISCIWEPILSLGSLTGFFEMGIDTSKSGYWIANAPNDGLRWLDPLIDYIFARNNKKKQIE